MRNDSILVLGGLALILFFASSGSRTVAEIEEKAKSTEELFEAWVMDHKDHMITKLMTAYLFTSQKLRRLNTESVKSMSKKDLLDMVHGLHEGPVDILTKLSRTVHTSFVEDKHLAEHFVDEGIGTMFLLLGLFEDVYGIFPGENRQSAEIVTQDLHYQLQRVKSFSL
tara:strand:- start:51 stop:554 length:504 start_codon:yes stop_codon:yes gene_type:complete